MLEQAHSKPEPHSELAEQRSRAAEGAFRTIPLATAGRKTGCDTRLLGLEAVSPVDGRKSSAPRQEVVDPGEVAQRECGASRLREGVAGRKVVAVREELVGRLLAKRKGRPMIPVRPRERCERERRVGTILEVVRVLSTGEQSAEPACLAELAALDVKPDEGLRREVRSGSAAAPRPGARRKRERLGPTVPRR